MYADSTVAPTDGKAAARADVGDRDAIAALLRDFYGRAFRDELLAPIFVDIARMDLEAHLPTMCDFWETVLFRAGSYRGNALHPHQRLHARANLTAAHFERWLALWCVTVDDRHVGPKAELAKLQGSRIAGAMSRRITGADLSIHRVVVAAADEANDPAGSGTARRRVPKMSSARQSPAGPP